MSTLSADSGHWTPVGAIDGEIVSFCPFERRLPLYSGRWVGGFSSGPSLLALPLCPSQGGVGQLGMLLLMKPLDLKEWEQHPPHPPGRQAFNPHAQHPVLIAASDAFGARHQIRTSDIYR